MDLINRQGLLAFQFKKLRMGAASLAILSRRSMTRHQDDLHHHGEAPLWPPTKLGCGPRLQELVDSFGEDLSEVLVAVPVPHANLELRQPSCTINQQSVIIFSWFF